MKEKLKNYIKQILILFILTNIFLLKNLVANEEKICTASIFEQKEKNDDDEKKWQQFEGYLIGNIIIKCNKQFNTKKAKNRFLRQIYLTLEFLTPNINSDIILSRLPFAKKNRLDIKKLKFAKKDLEEISYIDDIKIELEENPIDNTFVDIKVSFINKIPFMVDGIAMYICSSNFLGTGHQLSLMAVPGNGIFIDGYEIKYLVPNINNKNVNFSLINNKFTDSNLAKMKLYRPFARTVRIGGTISNAVGYKKIKTLGQSLKEISYKYNHFDLWCGKTINIWIENYNEFYKRLIITSGFNDFMFIDKPKNLKINKIPVLYDQRSIGFGIYYMNKKEIKIKDSYGKDNNDKIHEGSKIYLYGGFISNSQLYFGLDFSKGQFIKNLGYCYFNSKILKLTNGYFDNSNDKKIIIDSLLTFESNLGYISPKKKIGIEMRQIFSFNYLGNFGNTIPNLTSIDGYHFMEYYTNTFQV